MMTGLPAIENEARRRPPFRLLADARKRRQSFLLKPRTTQGKRSVLKYSSPLPQARNAIAAPASCSASSLQAAAR